ncbi:hypothetical protein LG293_17730 (plasmid) [Citricoccus nitrophenolicus]
MTSSTTFSAPSGYHVRFNAVLVGLNVMWLTAIILGPAAGMTAFVVAIVAGLVVGSLAVPIQSASLQPRTEHRRGHADPAYLRQMVVMAVLIGGLVGFFEGNVLIGVAAAGGLSFAAIHHHQKALARTAG